MVKRYEIGTPVIYNGKFATVTGLDKGTNEAIIEYCDWKYGKFVTAPWDKLTLDQDSIDEETAFQAENK